MPRQHSNSPPPGCLQQALQGVAGSMDSYSGVYTARQHYEPPQTFASIVVHNSGAVTHRGQATDNSFLPEGPRR